MRCWHSSKLVPFTICPDWSQLHEASRRPHMKITTPARPANRGGLDVISGLMRLESLKHREMLGYLWVLREQDNLRMVAPKEWYLSHPLQDHSNQGKCISLVKTRGSREAPCEISMTRWSRLGRQQCSTIQGTSTVSYHLSTFFATFYYARK